MKRVLGVAVVLAVALVMFAPSAQAGFYLGASATQTNLEVDNTSNPIDEDDTGWKAFGGWTILKFFGIELDYYEMGKPARDLIEVKLRAASLNARGILPLGKHFELFAKVGYAAWDADFNQPDADLDGTDVTYGAGAAFIIGGHVEIRAEYEIIDADAGDASNIDLNVISLGAAFRF